MGPLPVPPPAVDDNDITHHAAARRGGSRGGWWGNRLSSRVLGLLLLSPGGHPWLLGIPYMTTHLDFLGWRCQNRENSTSRKVRQSVAVLYVYIVHSRVILQYHLYQFSDQSGLVWCILKNGVKYNNSLEQFCSCLFFFHLLYMYFPYLYTCTRAYVNIYTHEKILYIHTPMHTYVGTGKERKTERGAVPTLPLSSPLSYRFSYIRVAPSVIRELKCYSCWELG